MWKEALYLSWLFLSLILPIFTYLYHASEHSCFPSCSFFRWVVGSKGCLSRLWCTEDTKTTPCLSFLLQEVESLWEQVIKGGTVWRRRINLSTSWDFHKCSFENNTQGHWSRWSLLSELIWFIWSTYYNIQFSLINLLLSNHPFTHSFNKYLLKCLAFLHAIEKARMFTVGGSGPNG